MPSMQSRVDEAVGVPRETVRYRLLFTTSKQERDFQRACEDADTHGAVLAFLAGAGETLPHPLTWDMGRPQLEVLLDYPNGM